MSKEWDYKKPTEALTPEFRKQYVTTIKGKEAILSDGLKKIAHIKGIKSLKSNIIQFPNAENNNLCIVETELIGYDYNPITDKVEEVVYKAIGDASPSNCSSMVAAAFVRMAETRSVSRVLKNYTNIGIVAVDELMDTPDCKQQNNNTINYNTNNNANVMTQEQSNLLKNIINEKKVPKIVLLFFLNKFKKNNFKDLTQQECQVIISQLQRATIEQIKELETKIMQENNQQNNSQQAVQ